MGRPIRAFHRLDCHLDGVACENNRDLTRTPPIAPNPASAFRAASILEGGAAIQPDPGGSRPVFLAAVLAELKQSAGMLETEGTKERVASRLECLEASYGRRIRASLPRL